MSVQSGSVGLIGEHGDYEHGGTQKDVYDESEVIAVDCPMCGSKKREVVYREHGAIGISQCKDCELIFTSPRLLSPEKIYWGEKEKYLKEARLIFEGRAGHHRDANYDEELDLIAKYKPTGRFLDVGCNAGFLLRKVKERGWRGIGVDPSTSLAELAREGSGAEVLNCYLDKIPEEYKGSFDVVALSDVFEHIVEPLPFLADARKLLKKDGILYVKVPNARWNLFKQSVLKRMGRTPKQGIWDSYEHVVHYTDESLRAMLTKGGFNVDRIEIGKPVQLPAWHYYVGTYYLYPSPFWMDWKRYFGRQATYLAATPERLLRGGSVGAMAPNIVAVATLAS